MGFTQDQVPPPHPPPPSPHARVQIAACKEEWGGILQQLMLQQAHRHVQADA